MTGLLADRIGLPRAQTELLAMRARRRMGNAPFRVRLYAFLLATGPLRRLIPVRLRRRAIGPLVHELLWGPSENLVYLEAPDGRGQ